MSKREAIIRYNLIINKLRKNPSTLKEIADMLLRESEIQGYNFNISDKTFKRDLNDIRSIYNIDIQYSFSRKVYYIDDDEQPEVNKRMLEAFDTFNALNLSERLSNHIHFEKRISQGTEHLYGLLHSIKNQYQITFSHQKYWEDESNVRVVEPYALKEFKNRWYILANDLKDNQVKTFGLDRISDLEISKKHFSIPENFDVDEYFRYCFGIISQNGHLPQEVILSFKPFQGKYIKTLPLHESQQILIDNDEELRIKLTLFITHDFIMELLSNGENLKVIKPKSLIADIKSSLTETLKQY